MEEKPSNPYNAPSPSSKESLPTQVGAEHDLSVSKNEGGSLKHYVVSQLIKF